MHKMTIKKSADVSHVPIEELDIGFYSVGIDEGEEIGSRYVAEKREDGWYYADRTGWREKMTRTPRRITRKWVEKGEG